MKERVWLKSFTSVNELFLSYKTVFELVNCSNNNLVDKYLLKVNNKDASTLQQGPRTYALVSLSLPWTCIFLLNINY